VIFEAWGGLSQGGLDPCVKQSLPTILCSCRRFRRGHGFLGGKRGRTRQTSRLIPEASRSHLGKAAHRGRSVPISSGTPHGIHHHDLPTLSKATGLNNSSQRRRGGFANVAVPLFEGATASKLARPLPNRPPHPRHPVQ
jgi:hypothetical protein